jgi:hypothetical protein
MRYWNDHANVCKQYPAIGKNWFRDVLIARPLTDDVLIKASNLTNGTSRSLVSFRSSEKYLQISTALYESPLIILSIVSPNYFRSFGLQTAIDPPHGNFAAPQRCRKWIAITVIAKN